VQDPPARNRLPDGLDDFCHGDRPKMTEEGMFLFGVVLGMLLHAGAKILIGLIKMALIALVV